MNRVGEYSQPGSRRAALVFSLALHALMLATASLLDRPVPAYSKRPSSGAAPYSLIQATLYRSPAVAPVAPPNKVARATVAPAPESDVQPTVQAPISVAQPLLMQPHRLDSNDERAGDYLNESPYPDADATSGNATNQQLPEVEPEQTLKAALVQRGQPDYAFSPAPAYPVSLIEMGIDGVVWLKVWVDSDGRPAQIKLDKSSGYRLLDAAALDAVHSWRFIPAMHGNAPIASWVEIPIRFQING